MKKIVTLLAVFLGLTTLVQGQNSLNNFTYTLNNSQPSVNAQGDTIYIITAEIDVQDSLGVTGVQVKVGSFLGGDDVVNHSFTVGQNYGLPNNYTITTQTNKIFIGFGYHQPGMYYPRIKLYDISGNSSGELVYNPATSSYILN